ncbi:MAG: trigger factor [Desulfofustis sp.]|nr:trigger factor [Desulfofustis sp.]MBT8355599.1 trigger factor [Desulfofustis sp.]NNF48091.1 trigger factor [Desulfofustis sp.]NNK57192.1 trigger factor [Desulfofustis sp.]
MDVKVEEVNALTRKVTITLPADEVKGKINKAYTKLQKEAKMKGFRRGKVPRSVIEKTYKPQVEAEVGEELVQETYFDIIEKQDFDPVVHPEIDEPAFNGDGSFTYVAKVDIRPDFELGEYKGIEVEEVDTDVEEGAIDFELGRIQREMAALKNVEDRAVAMDDIVVVDYQGYHKGNPMKHVKNEDFTVDVGKGQMDPEFEAKLIGMKKGEDASHEVEFPEKHPNPILAGKKVEFRIEVKDVKERVLAELDDEFAKDVNEKFETLDDLKAMIRERLEGDKKSAAEGELNDRIMKKLLENHQFEVPERLVRFEVEQMIKQTEEQLEKSGMDLESAGLNREELAKNNEPIAIQRVTGDFILKKIAEVEDIKVQDEDLDRAFKRIGDQYSMPVDRVKEFFKSRDDLLPLMNEVLNEKILNFLKEEAQFQKPKKKQDKEPAVEEPQEAEVSSGEKEE